MSAGPRNNPKNANPYLEPGLAEQDLSKFFPKEFTSSKNKRLNSANLPGAQGPPDAYKVPQIHPRLQLSQDQAWRVYNEKLEELKNKLNL